MTQRASDSLLLAATVVLASTAAPASAGATTTGPCLPDGPGPLHLWFGKVKSVSDGTRSACTWAAAR
jgi:hypothetical protein